MLIEAWRRHYNTARPPSSLGYRPQAPEAILPRGAAAMLWSGDRLTTASLALPNSLN